MALRHEAAIDVDAAPGTAASEHDITQVSKKLLHGNEQRVHDDAGYAGIQMREEHKNREVEWHIAVCSGKWKEMAVGSDELEQEKSKISVRVEPPFRWIKGIFGYSKVRYHGLDKKNINRLYLLLGFANPITCRRLGYAGQVCSENGKMD